MRFDRALKILVLCGCFLGVRKKLGRKAIITVLAASLFVGSFSGKTFSTGNRSPDKVKTICISDDNSPTWSPDGLQIAFESYRDTVNEIYVMNADGSNQRRLTHSPLSKDPVWSPDGNKIAYVTSRDGNDEIYVIDADGSKERNLTNNISSDTEPTWSPDGSKIAFTSSRDGCLEIYVMNADGSNNVNLTNYPPGK